MEILGVVVAEVLRHLRLELLLATVVGAFLVVAVVGIRLLEQPLREEMVATD
jgi:hypothetical protein